MLLLFAKGISALYGVSWGLWRIFGQFIVRSPPRDPPRRTGGKVWIKHGNSCKRWLKLNEGVFPQLFNAQAWDFDRAIAEKCGQALLSMIRDWQCYATRRQCYQDKGPSRSLSWVSLPNFLIWPENAGKPTLYIWSKGNAPDPWESKIHFSWLSSIDPDLDQYSRINTSTKWPWRSLSTRYLYFRWLSCIKTRFLEDTSSCFALELLERLVSTFSLRISKPSTSLFQGSSIASKGKC